MAELRDLIVNGSSTLNGTLTVNGNTTINGNIDIGAHRLTGSNGGSWISARDNAIVRNTSYGQSSGSSYNPTTSTKTTNGEWSIGNLSGTDNLSLVYTTDADYNKGNNSAKTFSFDTNGNYSGNSATATVSSSCSGNSATATIASSCSGNSATASKLTNITASDEASSTATDRYVFFSYDDKTTGRPAYSTDFTFQTSNGVLKLPGFVFKNSYISEAAENLSGSATINKATLYKNGILFPYKVSTDANDGGMIRCRGSDESSTIFELGTWDDYGTGETIQFNYYPTTSAITPTYSVKVPKKNGTILTDADIWIS